MAALLLLLGLVAQLAHSHPTRSLNSSNGKHAVVQVLSDDADTCPLCVAMHSAAPVEAATAEAVVFTTVLVLAAIAERRARLAPVPLQFSRPPPISC